MTLPTKTPEKFTVLTPTIPPSNPSWSGCTKQSLKRCSNNKIFLPEQDNKTCVFQLEDLSKTSTKVKNMFEIVFDPTKEKDKREKAADNLVVLARDRAGAEALHKEGVINQIGRLMKVEKDPTIRLSIVR